MNHKETTCRKHCRLPGDHKYSYAANILYREALHPMALPTASKCFYCITSASAYCLAGLAAAACVPVRSSMFSITLAPGGDTVPVFSTAMRIEPCSHQACHDPAAITDICQPAQRLGPAPVHWVGRFHGGHMHLGPDGVHHRQLPCSPAHLELDCTCCLWRCTRVCG